ncbi:MAG: ABC transporter permease [Chloroflexia bacterium]|nr:ABC transporter permease [Chloroflexia bacterium]
MRRNGSLAGFIESVVAVALALLLGGVALLLTGHDPVMAYGALAERVMFRSTGASEVLVRVGPLLIAGAAVLVSVRAGVWNIGIDGQVLSGALACAVVASALVGHVIAPVMWVAGAVAALAAGGAWALLPGLLRARLGLNEIITTIMLNYVALSLSGWLVKGPLKDPNLVAPQTPVIPRLDRLPVLGDTRLHLGLLVALVVALVVGYLLHGSRIGFELGIVGERPRVAHYAVMPVGRLLLTAFLVSGALAGLAGANDILSTKGTFQADWNPGYGLAAFALVFLARRRAVGLIPAALLLGALAYGADILPRAADVAPAFVDLLEGLILGSLALMTYVRERREGRAITSTGDVNREEPAMLTVVPKARA